MDFISLLDNSVYLKCQECDYRILLPTHCKKSMILKENKLVCHRGDHEPCCGSDSVMDLPKHHNKYLIVDK